MNKRVLCIWLPNWPVQRVQAAQPELAQRALVLQARDARRGLVVAAANLLARKQGVRAGMPLSEAVAIAQFEVREHDPQDDLDAICSLTEQAQQFSPIVGLESLDKQPWLGRSLPQPECLLLDVTGIAGLFGGEDQMLAEVARWLKEQHYFGCLALAGSVGAAWAVANYGMRHSEPAPQPAVPDSRCMSIAAGEDRDALGRLPVEALRLERTTVTALRRLAVRRIAQLWQLPRDGLATRLGQHLLDRSDQALGTIDEPIAALPSVPLWSVEQTLEYPSEHRETIFQVVGQLSAQLVGRLSECNQGALRIVCRLDMVESVPLVMQLGLFRPTDDARHITSLLTGQLEQQLISRRGTALWRASVQATLVAPLVWQQTDLFDVKATSHRQELARLVDILSSRLGRRQVLQATLVRESQPELACTFQPLTGRRHDGGQQSTLRKLTSRLARRRAEPSLDDPLRRPSHLFSPPIPSDVICLPDGPPAQFSYQRTVYRVSHHWGPERLESGWWRGPSQRRDYYRVEASDGSWWWLYRELISSQWFLHGAFD